MRKLFLTVLCFYGIHISATPGDLDITFNSTGYVVTNV